MIFKIVVRESTSQVLHIYNDSKSQWKMSQVVCDYGLRRLDVSYPAVKTDTLLTVQQSFAYCELTVV